MKQILVTGGTGYVGTRLVARLRAEGHTVTSHGLPPTSGDVVTGDLADAVVAERILGTRSWDVVINLAGPVTSGNEDLPTGIDVVAAHTRIALHVRRYAHAARIIHASSMTVYGPPADVDVREDAPRRPEHLYGLAKMLAEDVLLADGSLDAWILRLPGLFSEDRRNGALYHFARAACAGEPVRVTTAVPTPWNVLHVDDAVEAMAHAVTSAERAPGALNISYGVPIELVAIARKIAALGGRGSPVEHPAHVQHPPLTLVADRMTAVLRWSPPSLDDRLARLVSHHAAA